MHGEYKMPGGKLIVADIDISNNLFSKVQISGDFFLEPPSTLDTINQTLVGMPSTSSKEALSAAIEKNMQADVSMYGISSEAIAVAVLRACGEKQ